MFLKALLTPTFVEIPRLRGLFVVDLETQPQGRAAYQHGLPCLSGPESGGETTMQFVARSHERCIHKVKVATLRYDHSHHQEGHHALEDHIGFTPPDV